MVHNNTRYVHKCNLYVHFTKQIFYCLHNRENHENWQYLCCEHESYISCDRICNYFTGCKQCTVVLNRKWSIQNISILRKATNMNTNGLKFQKFYDAKSEKSIFHLSSHCFNEELHLLFSLLATPSSRIQNISLTLKCLRGSLWTQSRLFTYLTTFSCNFFLTQKI